MQSALSGLRIAKVHQSQARLAMGCDAALPNWRRLAQPGGQAPRGACLLEGGLSGGGTDSRHVGGVG